MLEGLILVDKPKGLSSFDVLRKLKKHFPKRYKLGHTGCLDPLATGLLPVLVGEATKFVPYLINKDKTYEVIARLGSRTSTFDKEGEVVAEQAVPLLTQLQIEEILEQFKGNIKQKPPIYSAIKFEGKPLYQYARQGIDIEIKEREVEIKSLELQKVESTSLHFKVHCSKGTYIRSLVDDIGQKIGCYAHVEELKRTEISGFSHLCVYSLENFEALSADTNIEKFIQPYEGLFSYPTLEATESEVRKLYLGQKFEYHGTHQDIIQIFLNGAFVGLGKIEEGAVKTERLLSFRQWF